ncbi:conjugative transposon protein TraN [Pontibacter litorisediminis]|uniref:conjugative transposon protein TraN n=1 Tax=Pontibacter litorisediminis TaxID=1846260 RepID=UPI0023EB6F5D|nr:conjugative transposon protein TraN [Pontibacter litorisediminis]
MGKLTIILSLMLASVACFAQEPQLVHVNKNISTHFVSPEPITYVDISTDDVAGDLPVGNILRIKPKKDKPALGIVTIVGERFMVQYRLDYSSPEKADTQVRIDPTQRDEYLNPDVPMSRSEMQRISLRAIEQKPRRRAFNRSNKVDLRLNNIYTMGDFYFVDVSMKNRSDIPYDIDQFRFKIEDKKVLKATNFQQLEVEPVFMLYDTDSFKRNYRNVFVFRRFTFPDEKVFNVEVAEEQVSGRTISLKVDYKDVLAADTL